MPVRLETPTQIYFVMHKALFWNNKSFSAFNVWKMWWHCYIEIWMWKYGGGQFIRDFGIWWGTEKQGGKFLWGVGGVGWAEIERTLFIKVISKLYTHTNTPLPPSAHTHTHTVTHTHTPTYTHTPTHTLTHTHTHTQSHTHTHIYAHLMCGLISGLQTWKRIWSYMTLNVLIKLLKPSVT